MKRTFAIAIVVVVFSSSRTTLHSQNTDFSYHPWVGKRKCWPKCCVPAINGKGMMKFSIGHEWWGKLSDEMGACLCVRAGQADYVMLHSVSNLGLSHTAEWILVLCKEAEGEAARAIRRTREGTLESPSAPSVTGSIQSVWKCYQIHRALQVWTRRRQSMLQLEVMLNWQADDTDPAGSGLWPRPGRRRCTSVVAHKNTHHVLGFYTHLPPHPVPTQTRS